MAFAIFAHAVQAADFDFSKAKILSRTFAYLEAPSAALEKAFLDNEQVARSSATLGRPIVFRDEAEARKVLAEEFSLKGGFGISRINGGEFGGVSGFPVAAYLALSDAQKRRLAGYQTRVNHVRARVTDGRSERDLADLLPETVKTLSGHFASEIPEVVPKKIGDIFPEAPKALREQMLYPQCYSATLHFWGLLPELAIFAPRETFLGDKTISEAQIELFTRNGFSQRKIANASELKFGDVITGTGSHTFVYLLEDLVFEKPDGDPYTAFVIDQTKIDYWLNESTTVVLRKNGAKDGD